jgi:Alw26I/Eco31I/Esp3I family type II restriction m6 adenine DNA methyltransferase
VIEKDRGEASWPHDLFREYLNKTSRLDTAKGGKLNLFRFFLVQALQLSKPRGRIGMIMPMSILADISCKETRAAFLDNTSGLEIDAFPQKDNRNHRVFYEAKLSTAILTAPKKQDGRQKIDTKISLRVFPRNSFMDNPKYAELKRSELSTLDPDTMPIPICDQKAWNLAQRLSRSNAVSRLGEIEGISVNRGEINQTIFRKFITSNPEHARLLKGAEIGQYRIKTQLSQGEVEWFDAEKYRKAHSVPPQVSARRIATQRITGVDERLRIVATMAGPDWFFADSTNSILVSKGCLYAPEYVLALLNSKLFQWRFKITSTNNNVGTNELNSLPVRDIHSEDATDKKSYDLIVSSVKTALRSGSSAEESKSERSQKSAELAMLDAVRIIDEEIAKLYGLTDEEIEVVESASIVPQAASLGEAAWAVPA